MLRLEPTKLSAQVRHSDRMAMSSKRGSRRKTVTIQAAVREGASLDHENQPTVIFASFWCAQFADHYSEFLR
jgi:hypothetical protein